MSEVAFEVHCPALFNSNSNKSHMNKSNQRPQDYWKSQTGLFESVRDKLCGTVDLERIHSPPDIHSTQYYVYKWLFGEVKSKDEVT